MHEMQALPLLQWLHLTSVPLCKCLCTLVSVWNFCLRKLVLESANSSHHVGATEPIAIPHIDALRDLEQPYEKPLPNTILMIFATSFIASVAQSCEMTTYKQSTIAMGTTVDMPRGHVGPLDCGRIGACVGHGAQTS